MMEEGGRPARRPEGTQVRVSIFEERDSLGSENLTVNEFADTSLEADEEEKNVDRKDSFLMPAINFARRLSMKITGSRDVNLVRKRARRTPKPNITEAKPGRRKSIFDPRNSLGARMSINLDTGVVLLDEEPPNGGLLEEGMKRVRALLRLHPKDPPERTEKEPVRLQELEPPRRYRPHSLAQLSRETGFTRDEIKRLYRGFKTECPTGILSEEGFHNIYANFFPWGEENYHSNICSYSHYLFSLLDDSGTGSLTFGDFVANLSLLIRGSEEERLLWTFKLYDIKGDGVISREEMEDVAMSIFDLMGSTEEASLSNFLLKQKIVEVFQDMDKNGDGEVSQDEFISYCLKKPSVKHYTTSTAL